MPDIKHVAIYCRVSTQDQDTLTQQLILESHARKHKWKFKTFLEVESSGKSRPVKQQVLTLLRSGKFDAVLIYKLDRWARSTVELILEMSELTKKGIGFISLSDKLEFTTAAGKLHFTILAAFTEFERSLISERTRDGLARKKATGVKLGRPKGAKDKKKGKRPKGGYYERELKKRKSL